MAVKNDWIYFILTKLLAMVFVVGILWERYRCFFEKTVIRLVDISHIPVGGIKIIDKFI